MPFFTAIQAQPEPELRHAGLDEIFLHLVDAAEILGDLLLQRTRNGTAAIGLHPVPEMQVVEMLTGIVEQRLVDAISAFHDLLEALALEFRTLQQLVAGGDIGLMVLVVVVFERLGRHIRLKRVICVGQLGKAEGHVDFLS